MTLAFSTEQFHRFYESLERIANAPEGLRLRLMQDAEAEFGSNVADYVAIAAKLRNPITHAVILIHGIRDDGAWFNFLKHCLAGHPYIRVSFGGYGYFNILSFLWSGAQQKIALDAVVRSLRNEQGNNTVVSVICHSLATYCVTKAVLENPDIRLFRLILCGSVVSRKFPWDRVPAAFSDGRVVNDCGNDDDVPVFARTLDKEVFGDTGRFGFAHTPVTDRWHDTDHGGFFTEALVTSYWVPFLTRGEIVSSGVPMRKPGFWIGLLAGRFP